MTATPTDQLALLWVLNLSDGRHSLLDISDRSGLPFPVTRTAADRLSAAGLLAEVPHEAPDPAGDGSN